MKIEEYIPAGYDKRVSRGYLCEILHIPDREVRKQIEAARGRLVAIASYDGGYFRYMDERDTPYFEAYQRQEDKRFRTQSHNNKLRKEAWARIHPEAKDKNYIPGQMEMEFING